MKADFRNLKMSSENWHKLTSHHGLTVNHTQPEPGITRVFVGKKSTPHGWVDYAEPVNGEYRFLRVRGIDMFVAEIYNTIRVLADDLGNHTVG